MHFINSAILCTLLNDALAPKSRSKKTAREHPHAPVNVYVNYVY